MLNTGKQNRTQQILCMLELLAMVAGKNWWSADGDNFSGRERKKKLVSEPPYIYDRVQDESNSIILFLKIFWLLFPE